MPKRRSVRLQEKEEQFMKKPAKLSSSTHEAMKPLIQKLSIFDPAICDVLPKIINNMDPCSFVRFARTCKEMKMICFNSTEIQIPCWDRMSDKAKVFMDPFNPSSWTLRVNDCEYTTDSEFMKKLSKMPFTYNLNNLCIYPQVNGRLLNEIRNNLALFPRVLVRSIYIGVLDDDDDDHHASADDWNGFVEFIREFRVTSFCSCVEVPLEIMSYLAQNMYKFQYFRHVPDNVILSATAGELYLRNAKISRNTFKELVKRFHAGFVYHWTLGREQPNDLVLDDELDEIQEHAENQDQEEEDDEQEDPFLQVCSEIMEVVHVNNVHDIKKPDMRPSTIYISPISCGPVVFAKCSKCSLLRSDGSVGYIFVFPDKVGFSPNGFALL